MIALVLPAYAGVLVCLAAALGVWLLILEDTIRLFRQWTERRSRPDNSSATRTKEKESFVSE